MPSTQNNYPTGFIDQSMKATCRNCQKEFTFTPSHQKGIYCSNRCQGDFVLKSKFKLDTKFSNAMRKYILNLRGLRCESPTCHAFNGYTDSNPKAFQIDHINGDRRDNRYENLMVMCGTCHLKTETWGQGNVSKQGLDRMRHGSTRQNKP